MARQKDKLDKLIKKYSKTKRKKGLSDAQIEAGHRGWRPKVRTLAVRVADHNDQAGLPQIDSVLGKIDAIRATGIDASARRGIKHSK